MILWQGWGIAVIFIVFAILALVQLVVDAVLGRENYSGNYMYAGLGLLVSAGAVWLFGRFLESRSEPRTLIDKESGSEVVLQRSDSLFFIKVRYWPFILVAGAAVAVILELVG